MEVRATLLGWSECVQYNQLPILSLIPRDTLKDHLGPVAA